MAWGKTEYRVWLLS